MTRAVVIASCLARMFAGFGVGTAVVFGAPWSIPANLLAAGVVAIVLGAVEILAVRRFGTRRTEQPFLRAGRSFPFAAAGVAAAVLIFGTH